MGRVSHNEKQLTTSASKRTGTHFQLGQTQIEKHSAFYHIGEFPHCGGEKRIPIRGGYFIWSNATIYMWGLDLARFFSLVFL